MNHRRRVVITGLGVVAPNGIGKDAFWQNLIAGKSAVDRITMFDTARYPSHVAAEIRRFDPTDYMPARTAKSVERFTQLAVAASVLALRDSNLPEHLGSAYQTAALYFGTSASGSADIGDNKHAIHRDEPVHAELIGFRSASEGKPHRQPQRRSAQTAVPEYFRQCNPIDVTQWPPFYSRDRSSFLSYLATVDSYFRYGRRHSPRHFI